MEDTPLDDQDLSFGERLILAEERRRTADTPPAGPEVIAIERQGFTTRSSFHVREPGREMPVAGPGQLLNLVVVADSDQFRCDLELDGRVIVADPFTTLQAQSNERSRVSAYQRNDGQYVWSAHEYQFQDAVDAVVTPQEQITFSLQRAEIDVVREHGG